MSKKLTIQTSQLLIERRNQSTSTAQVFVSKPSANQERELGKLMGIIRIDSTSKKIPGVIDLILQTLQAGYYDRPPAEKNEQALEEHFEKILQRINNKLEDFIKEEKIRWDINKVHLLIGLLKNRHFYFTKTGETHAFLLRQNKQQQIQMYDISADDEDSSKKESTAKLFGHLMSGELVPGDSIFISTNNVLDFVSQEKIKTLVSTLPANSAVEQLKNLLTGASINTTFSAIVLRLLGQKAGSDAIEKPASQRSLDGMLATEETTAHVLSPQLKVNLKKQLSGTLELLSTGWRKIKTSQVLNKMRQERTPQEIADDVEEENHKSHAHTQVILDDEEVIEASKSKLAPTLTEGAKRAGNIGKMIVMRLATGVKNLRHLRKESRREHLTHKTRDKAAHVSSWYGRLPKNSKILLLVVIVFGFLFIQSLVWLGRRQETRGVKNEYEQSVATIEQMLNDAEAKIIYEDEERAREILSEVDQLIIDLPQDSRKKRQIANDFEANIATQYDRLRHIVKLERPEIFTSFSAPSAENNVSFMFASGKSLYAYDQGAQKLYIIDLAKQKEPASVKLDELSSPLAQATEFNTDQLLFAQADNSYLKYDTETKTFTPLEVPAKADLEIQDIEIYNGRLYTLDSNNGQLWRHSRLPDAGYREGQAWVKESGLQIDKASSIVIDGNIYFLFSSGEVYQMAGGFRKDFALKSIDPPLNQPTKIWTSIDSDFLYILDPNNDRLVIINKDKQAGSRYGSLVVQYTSDKFNDLKDFVVREGERKIYLLNNNTVYQFEAEHLP